MNDEQFALAVESIDRLKHSYYEQGFRDGYAEATGVDLENLQELEKRVEKLEKLHDGCRNCASEGNE